MLRRSATGGWIRPVLLALLVLVALGGGASWYLTRLILWPAVRSLHQAALEEGRGTPADVGLPFRDVTFEGERGAALRGWLVPGPRPPDGVPELDEEDGSEESPEWVARPRPAAAILVHGHKDNRVGMLKILRTYHDMGFTVLLYDNRCHGASGGDVFTMGVLESRDLLRARKWLIGQGMADPDRVVVHGASMGAQIALVAAATPGRPFAAVVADSASSDIRVTLRDYARRLYGLPGWACNPGIAMAEWRGGFSMDTVVCAEVVPKIEVPILFIHGGADDRIPPWHSEKLAGLTRLPSRRLVIPKAGHGKAVDVDRAACEGAVKQFYRDSFFAEEEGTSSSEPVSKEGEQGGTD